MLIVMEYIRSGNLKAFIVERSSDPFNDQEASQLMKSILSGVAEMHSKNIIHRDLKPGTRHRIF
jgi:serine/threonine protein kinase